MTIYYTDLDSVSTFNTASKAAELKGENQMELVGPIVNLRFTGEVHMEDGRLIVGDTDVVRRFQAAFGGHRQLGQLQMILHLIPQQNVEVSPSGDGMFTEGSEP